MSKPVDLDQELSKPLAEVADDGFSHAVTVRLLETRARRERLVGAAVAGAVALVCLAMPFTEIGQAINHSVLALVQQMSEPLKIVAGALVVCGLILQLYSDAIEPRPTSRS